MAKIHIGFKAFDAHELLCHFVAVRAGLYKRENIDVELIDITFMDDLALPAHITQVSCGAALSAALKGSPQRVVFVATDRPMFWLYGKAGIKRIDELKNGRIATYPAIAPPHHLANIILGKSGINVVEDVTLLPARDDVARFGLLSSGSVDAAVISSAIAPPKIQAAGMQSLCFFGDEIRIPTTGFAVKQTLLDSEPGLIEAQVAILKQALSLIHEDADIVAATLKTHFDVTDNYKEETARLFRPCYTLDGRSTREITQNAIKALCQSLAISAIPDYREIYQYL